MDTGREIRHDARQGKYMTGIIRCHRFVPVTLLIRREHAFTGHYYIKTATMTSNFNKYIRDAEQFVKEVATELGIPEDIGKADRIFRAVVHTLRNRLTPPESLQLIAQFPMLIKAIYVDGWRISDEARRLRRLGDFIEAVREQGGAGTHDDFVTDLEVEKAIRAVFRVLKNHVSAGEISDILATFPKEFRPLLAEA